MIEKLLAVLSGFVIGVISNLGYGGVALLMAIESACIPLPSEVIMPFSGYLAWRGDMTLWGVALAGAVGCVLGSLVAYYAGAWGGRPLVEKYGRYVLISHHDLDLADRWFSRHGDITIFVGRLLPIIRTFIAFPAGISRMHLGRFVIYTFVGSFLWCYGLAWLGYTLGENWTGLKVYFHRFDFLIGAALLLGLVWYVRRHLRR
ncbi:MAG: DedA family protein [Pseudomonadota bacterium]|uniref:DedA family protein n=1 Tax=Thermithiobacillus tepidarius TaxID=929 RepID=UPI00041DBFF0|nr:DedA family protein [Thermithiobacillus tepidarius]